MNFMNRDEVLNGVKRGADKFGSKEAGKVVEKIAKRINGLVPDSPEPYGLGMGGSDTEQTGQQTDLYPAKEKANAIPEARPRQQAKLDFLKAQLPLLKDPAEKKPVEDEIKALEAELAAMPHGDPDARQEKGSSVENEDSSNLGYQSDQKTTTAQRSEENAMQSRCPACGYESENPWNGKCEGCGVMNEKDVSGKEIVKNADLHTGDSQPTKDDVIDEKPGKDSFENASYTCQACGAKFTRATDAEKHQKDKKHTVEMDVMENAGHLDPLDWNGASLEDKIVLLESAGQDINLAPLAFDQLSMDVKVAMQREIDQMKIGALSNEKAEEKENTKFGPRKCEECGSKISDSDVNYGACTNPNCKKYKKENASGRLSTFIFADKNGEEERVEAKDEASALAQLARDLGATPEDLKGMGIKLIKKLENSADSDMCDDCGRDFKPGDRVTVSKMGEATCDSCRTKASGTNWIASEHTFKNADPEGDLAEIASHAEGIEHEVQELQEEGMENKDISKSEIGEEIAHHEKEKDMPPKQAVAVAFREAGLSRGNDKYGAKK